jgi:membrane protein implicated in regulation of membrane protease activity
MSQDSTHPTTRRSTGLWVLIVIILIPPVVLPLWVPLYNKTDPTLWGFPFFFWFQFALILFSAALTVTAFALSRAASRREKRGDHR